MTMIEGDVIRYGESEDPSVRGAVTPVRGYLASDHVRVLHGLLPQPTSPLQEWPGRAGLAERAVAGMVHAAIEYKAVLLAPLVVAVTDLAASIVHFAPHHFGAGVAGCLVGVASTAFGALVSLAHVNNAPAPHHAATHHAGHHGKILGVTFGLGLFLLEVGTTVWLGPINALSWVAGMTATIGGAIGIAAAVHHGKGHKHIRDTDRIRAVADLATATAIDPGYMPQAASQYDQHPLSMEVVYALSVLGWPGATIDAMPVVVNPNRWTLTANLPDGIAFKTVKAKEAEIAATLRLVAGGLTLSQGRGSHQAVFNVNNIAVAELPKPGAHPAVEAPGRSVSIWDPFRFGLDDDSEVDIVLAGTPGMLIAGAPGSGKSTAVAAPLCHVAQAVDCELWTIDGSGRELVIFEEVAHQHCGPDIDAALALLEAIQAEIVVRAELLRQHRATELTRELAEDLQLDCIAVFIGELAYFTNHEDAKKRNLFNLKLRDQVSRGRAVGIFLVADTQKPEDKVVPSAIRDMVPLKLALRCETDDQVNTILGRGMAKQYPAHEIPVGEEGNGIGYLKGVPGRKPFRLRTHRITAKERYAIVDEVKDGFTAPPPIVPGPGGGQDVYDQDEDGFPPLRLVRGGKYPGVNGRPGEAFEGENWAAVWGLLERLPEGFTYRDVAALAPSVGIYGGRGSVQKFLDSWDGRGLIVQVGERRGQAGPPAKVYQRVDRLGEYGEATA